MNLLQEHIKLLQAQLVILRRMYEPPRRYRAGGKRCQKGFSCGASCIARKTRKGKETQCRKALAGEARNYSEYIVQKMSAGIGGVLGDKPVEKPKSALPEWMQGEPVAESLANGVGRTIATGYHVGTGTIEAVNPPSQEYPSGSIRVKNARGEQDTFDTFDLRDKIKRGEARLIDENEPEIKIGSKSTRELGDRALVNELLAADPGSDPSGRELANALSEVGTDKFSREKVLDLADKWIKGEDESGWENAVDEFESPRSKPKPTTP